MKDFNALSGPWTGLSIQGRRRLTESLQLRILQGTIEGTGSDVDGEFDVRGTYQAGSERVTMIRIYTWTTDPSQDSVGLPFVYDGTWDGEMVHGHWVEPTEPSNTGPFEMWPDREEDRKERAIDLSEQTLTAGA